MHQYIIFVANYSSVVESCSNDRTELSRKNDMIDSCVSMSSSKPTSSEWSLRRNSLLAVSAVAVVEPESVRLLDVALNRSSASVVISSPVMNGWSRSLSADGRLVGSL